MSLGTKSSVTASSSDNFSNKTLDMDNNTMLNLEASSFKAGEVVDNLGPVQPDYVKPAAAKAVQDSLASKLESTNDLSDLNDASAARTNLSVPSVNEMKAYVQQMALLFS